MKRNDRAWLEDILDAIAHVERYTAAGRDTFDQNELVRVWTIHHIEIIGEAAAHLPEAFTGRHAHVPWPQIVAMRNVLIHAYYSIVDDEVWNTVENDLPALKAEIEKILQQPS